MSALQIVTDEPPREASQASPSYGTFEELYAGTRDAVFAYVMGLLRDRHAAEEVTAQAFERAYRKRRLIDETRGDARSWLFGIARNAALDELRRLRRHATPTDPDALADVAMGDDVRDLDQRIALHQALDARP